MRELSYGSKRFSDLRVALGLSPNVLTQRLGELEEHGVVQRRTTGGAVYELTDWGRDLHPILVQLGYWGARSAHRPAGELSVDALLLALEATFQREKAAELRATIELLLGEERFTVQVSDGALAITRGSPRSPDVVIETDPGTLRSLVFGELQLSGAAVALRGDTRTARTFFRLFARP